jgi:hypothetical protein
MRAREMGSLIFLGAVICAAIIGISSKYITKENDGPIEEFTEEFIEDQIEKIFDLENDELKDKIDFSHE